MRNSKDLVQLAYSKITYRLLPFLSGCFVLAYLDRFNVGFAQLQIATDLHLSSTAYGFGAGIFFVGYLLFEVPANIILARVGARRWIAWMMVVWGMVSLATAFVHSAAELYAARFLLGVAEAGFFPGVVYYLSRWYPDARRASAVAFLTTAIAVSGIISGAISGLILQHLSYVGGLRGWQWLFLLEGTPSVVAGIAASFVLADDVSDAAWLNHEEKAVIVEATTCDAPSKAPKPISHILIDAQLWHLGFVNFCLCMGLYVIGFWLPQLLQKAGAGNALQIGLWTVVPYGIALPLMLGIARVANSSFTRRRLLIACMICESAGLVLSAVYDGNFIIAITALTLTTAGILTAVPLFWTLPAQYLQGNIFAAAGIALVNSIGAVAGFASPFLIGTVRDATHSTAGGICVIAAIAGIGGVSLAFMPHYRNVTAEFMLTEALEPRR